MAGDIVVSSSRAGDVDAPNGKNKRLYKGIHEVYQYRKPFVTVPGSEDFRAALMDLVRLGKSKTPDLALFIRVEKFLFDFGVCLQTFMESSAAQYKQREGETEAPCGAEDFAEYCMYVILAELEVAKKSNGIQRKDIQLDEHSAEQARDKISRFVNICSKTANALRQDARYQYIMTAATVGTVPALTRRVDGGKSVLQDYEKSLSKDTLEMAKRIYGEFQKSSEKNSYTTSDVHAEKALIVSKLIERRMERFVNPAQCACLDDLKKAIEAIQENINRQIENGQFALDAGNNREKKQFLDDTVGILNDKKLSYKEREAKLKARTEEMAKLIYGEFQKPSEKNLYTFNVTSDVHAENAVIVSKLIERSVERFVNPAQCVCLDDLKKDVEAIQENINQQIENGQFDLSAGNNQEKKQFLDDTVGILNDKKLSYKEREAKLKDHTENSPEKISMPPKGKNLGYCVISLIGGLFSWIPGVKAQCRKYLQKYNDANLGRYNEFFCQKVSGALPNDKVSKTVPGLPKNLKRKAVLSFYAEYTKEATQDTVERTKSASESMSSPRARC